MKKIIRVIIKGASGYCSVDEAYTDKVTITSSSIAYEYIPEIESEINPKRKWSYKTNNPLFAIVFDKICGASSPLSRIFRTPFRQWPNIRR